MTNRLLFQKECPICAKPAQAPDFLCGDCREKINHYNKQSKCAICGQPTETTPLCAGCQQQLPTFDLAISSYAYEGDFQKSLLEYKYQKQFYRAKGFSLLLLETYQKLGVQSDLIAAVPSGLFSLWKRTYSSPLEMAFCLKKKLHLPLYARLLMKKPFTPRQSTLSGKDRLKNAKGSFLVSPFYRKKIKGKSILLIDDVFTTGATARECSRVLKQAGADSVYVVTLLGNSPM